MSKVLEPGDFVTWFDAFMPAVHSDDFKPLTTPIELKESYLPEPVTTTSIEPVIQPDTPSEEDSESEPTEDAETESEPTEDEQLKGSKSHLIGLSFYRAGALSRLAAALPEDDVRRPAYRRLAAIHGANGFTTMYEADYVGTHWLASYAVYMLAFDE